VFAAASSRDDQWRQLNALARSWANLPGKSTSGDKLRKDCGDLLEQVSRLEHCWAYPGPKLIAAIGEALGDRDASAFARLVQKVSGALLSGDFRRDDSAWDPNDDGDETALDSAPPDITGMGYKPYFEVLIVTPVDPRRWARSRDEMRRLRKAEDEFHYSIVQVGSFEDAALAVMVNDSINAVVLIDGFQYESRHDLPTCRPSSRATSSATRPRSRRARSRRAREGDQEYRPELDLYLLSDRTAESIAARKRRRRCAACSTRSRSRWRSTCPSSTASRDRVETPYFDNLQKYAQRPIGTFHALPIARGKSVFRSNWIRDFGHFYGTNIFMAESSATTGGLDSLLEPTGNIKKAQEACRARVRREARVLRHRTAPRPRTRSWCRPCASRATSSSSTATATSRTTTASCSRARSRTTSRRSR
jgi:arginine decarboxylase